MSKKQLLGTWRVCVAVGAGVAISACGGSDSAGGEAVAVFLGPVSSETLLALPASVRMGGAAAEADILIVDGDTVAAGSLATDAVIQAHLAKGKILMVTEAKASHKAADIQALVHAAPQDDSHAVLMRRSLDAHGRPAIHMLNLPTDMAQPGITRRQMIGFRQAITQFLKPPASAAVGNFNPPPGLLYVIFNLSIPTVSVALGATEGGDDRSNTPQHTSAVVTYKYTVLLENGQVASGDRQFVVVETQIDSSPLNQALGTTQMAANKSGSGFSSSNMGWFQAQVDNQIIPANTTPLVYQTDGPQNTNNVTQVSTSVGFGVNFAQPFGGGVSNYNYNQSSTQDLTAWEVLNQTTGVIGKWTWINQDPWMFNDPGRWDGYGFGGGLHGFAEFRVPNDLAMNLLTADTKIVYATSGLARGFASFNHTTNVQYLNVWDKGGGVKSQTGLMKLVTNWSISLAAVLPIPIVNIAYSANPVSVKTTNQVTGTVVLQSPAAVDTTILLKSTSANASVLDSVVIPQGQTSVDFQILINPNNLAPGSSTVATIQAYDAFGFQNQLTITN